MSLCARKQIDLYLINIESGKGKTFRIDKPVETAHNHMTLRVYINFVA